MPVSAYPRRVTWTRLLPAAVAVLLVVVYAVGSGRWVTTSGDWYLNLTQPPWQPPPPVFGLAWSYNFIALIVVGLVISLQAQTSRTVTYLALFAVSIGFALAWAYLFYVPHELLASAVFLSLCALTTVGMVVLAFSERWWLGALLLPYQAWLIIAASLSWGYVRLN